MIERHRPMEVVEQVDNIQVRIADDRDPHELSRREWMKKGLWQKVKESYKESHHDPIASAVANATSIGYFWFIVVTELYVIIGYVIPEQYSEYDPMTRYYLKVISCFVFIQTCANWMCVRFYDSFISKTEDIPHEIASRRSPTENGCHHNGSLSLYHDNKSGLPWTHCSKCGVDVPYRGHHCIICDKCILKRDHHCYMTGVCVGFYNQRYFIVLNFYVAIASVWGLYEIVLYMNRTFVPTAIVWDYFIPVTWFRWLLGTVSFHQLLMMFHLYTLWWTGFTAFAFFVWHMFIILLGKTTHEVQSYAKVRSTASVSSKFASVFGPFWLINFIFPAVLIFKQQGDGKQWNAIRKC